MCADKKHVPLAGSEREPVPGTRVIGDVDPSQTFEITVRVRPRSEEDKAALLKKMDSQPPAERQYLSRDEFANKFGADPADLEKVINYAHENDLTIVKSSAPERTVVLRGTAQALTKAFPVALKQYDSPAGGYRGRTGPVQVPEELQGIVEGVFGFDNRPQAAPRSA